MFASCSKKAVLAVPPAWFCPRCICFLVSTDSLNFIDVTFSSASHSFLLLIEPLSMQTAAPKAVSQPKLTQFNIIHDNRIMQSLVEFLPIHLIIFWLLKRPSFWFPTVINFTT